MLIWPFFKNLLWTCMECLSSKNDPFNHAFTLQEWNDFHFNQREAKILSGKMTSFPLKLKELLKAWMIPLLIVENCLQEVISHKSYTYPSLMECFISPHCLIFGSHALVFGHNLFLMFQDFLIVFHECLHMTTPFSQVGFVIAPIKIKALVVE